MVCSQVYSQHPSPRLLSVAHQHRSWGSRNAEMRLLEEETSERECKGNSPSGVNLRLLKDYGCTGYASVSSPIKSSWIQRLIPAHTTRVEKPQFSNSMSIGSEGSDGLQVNCSYDAVFKSQLGKQSAFASYENSRRSRQVLSSRHEILLTKSTACNEQLEMSAPGTSRICDLEVLQPKIQLPPRTLPVVECLLNPGCSKRVMEAQLSVETNNPRNFSKSSGFSNPIKQTVHFSADERYRVSCSSIEGLNLCTARCAAGDANASLWGEKCFNASQPALDFSFNHLEAALRSHVDSVYGGQTWTYSGMDLTNGWQTGEIIHAESRDPVSTRGLVSLERRNRSDESRFLDRGVLPSQVDKKSIQRVRNRNAELPQEQNNYEKGATLSFEVSCGQGGAFTGAGCSNSGLGKDVSQRVSDLVSSQVKASISLAPRVVEQGLDSSRDSHKEQDFTSGSFSFQSNGRLPYVSVDAKVAIEKGHWPFCERSSYIEPSVQSRLPTDQRTRNAEELLRPGMPLTNATFMQPELQNAYICRSQCSPFFGTETLTEYGRHRLAYKHEVLPQKPPSMDISGVYTGESYTEALYIHGVTQDAGIKQEKGRHLNDGIMSSRLQPNEIIKGVKEREKYANPSEAISQNSWEGFKPPLKISTVSVGSIESCSKRPADLGTQDLVAAAEARNQLSVAEGAVTLPPANVGEHSLSFSVGSGLNKTLDGPRSEGRGLRSWDDGSLLRQSMWFKRWSTTASRREGHALLKLQSNQERGIVNGRHFVKSNQSSSQSSWESSHHFDLRPAKRACYGQRFGLHSEPCQGIPVFGSIGLGRQNQQEIDVTSHFMKRFSTPSAAAMAVMGMTARKMHATQPKSKGLFGVWPLMSSESNKPLKDQVKVGKEFLTRQLNEKEFLHSSVKRSSTQVDA